MNWEEGIDQKFVKREDNPSQDNYSEPYLDGNPLELIGFIHSLLKQQREICATQIDAYDSHSDNVIRILNSPEPGGKE